MTPPVALHCTWLEISCNPRDEMAKALKLMDYPGASVMDGGEIKNSVMGTTTREMVTFRVGSRTLVTTRL